MNGLGCQFFTFIFLIYNDLEVKIVICQFITGVVNYLAKPLTSITNQTH